jgi:HEAT repeat protein
VIWGWIYLLLLSGGPLWLGVGTLRNILQSQARRLRLWRSAAAACGLSVVGTSSVWTWRLKLEAKADPIAVRIEGAQQPGNVGTRIVVTFPGPPGFSEVRIRPDQLFVLREPQVLEILIGDPAFDQTFIVEGPLRLIGGLLDAEARRLLLDLNNQSRVVIAHSELRAEIFDHQLSSVLPLLLELGRRFAQKTDIVHCLAENLRRDPEAGVRLNNLLALVRECAWGPKTEETLRAACSDPSPQVRLHAAKELGGEGRSVLLALAESTEDDDCSAEALRLVGTELPLERTQAILDRALAELNLETARACLEVLGRSGTAAAVDALARFMVRDSSELACAAALALGATGNAAAEPPLIQALEGERSDLRVAAAKALGLVGSAAAVQPLKEAVKGFSWIEAALIQATRQAIAEIQSRLPGATPGELSLAEAETGQLSLAQAEAGELSLATNPAGQLSLPSKEPGEGDC